MEKRTDNEKQARKKSGIITLGIALLTVALLFMSLKAPFPPLEPEGLLIDFGNSATGLGKTEPQSKIANAAPPVTTQQTPVKKEVVTQKMEQTISVPKDKPKDKPVVTENKVKTTKKQETKPEEKIDENQLFSKDKINNSSKSTSEGNTAGNGNMGDPKGKPDGYQGSGSGIGDNGTSGVGHDLSGRSIIKREPGGNPPESGKIVFLISVDRNGNIVSAEYERRGSTIVDQKVISEARASLLNKKWFQSNTSAPEKQTGHLTISYTLQ